MHCALIIRLSRGILYLVPYGLKNMERNSLRDIITRFTAVKTVLINCLCLCSYSYIECYNLDVDHAVHFRGPNGSLFGYSVLLHKHREHTWVLVGAPISNSSYDQIIKTPGAIYKCNITDQTDCEQIKIGIRSGTECGKTCYPEFDNQWLGVSLSGQQGRGHVLACGHRWKNIFYTKKENQNKLPHGVCYKLESDLKRSTPLIPCYRDHQRKFGQDYGSCQAGISNFQTEDLIVMGAPGTSYWAGSVLVYNTTSRTTSAYVNDDNIVLYGSYLGYSTGAGHFSLPHTTEVVGGAPQHGQTGKAYIFKVEPPVLRIIFEAKGTELGGYFGASVCAVDLNSDGLSDLLVGAPLSSVVREEGRVHVYMNHGAANMTEVEFELLGSNLYGARFGETITNLGDIDDDGFPDVAVGAPQEEDLRGAIYIYNGRKTGISRTFSQRITGSLLGHAFKMFGQSVSGVVDVDGNGYPDIAVGAFLSDSVVLLRTRAVVIVKAVILLPPAVNRSLLQCEESGRPAICINVRVCFRIWSKHIMGTVGMHYNMTADVRHRESLLPRFYFTGNVTSNTTTGSVNTRHQHLTCVNHSAFMRKDVQDIFTPIHFELKYELGEHNVMNGVSGGLPALKPILQQAEENNNLVSNKTVFARYCAWVNCSTNLQVSAHLGLPQSHKNMSYFAVGSRKTAMLNVTLVNVGDAALLPRLSLRFPSNIYFIKVLGAEKYTSCEIVKPEKATIGLDCSVGNLFIKALAKISISFLLDVNQSSDVGDLDITINATSESFESKDLLHDNIANMKLPLRYGAELNVHGFFSPKVFVFGDQDNTACYTERFNYTLKVLNVGPSKALGAKVEIDIPNVLAPYPYRLLNIIGVQGSVGECYIKSTSYETKDGCEAPKPEFIEQVVLFLSKAAKRQMYCTKEDLLCLYVLCELGDLSVATEATVQMEMEMKPHVLDIHPGRDRVMVLESTAVVSLREGPYILPLQETSFTKVVLEARYHQKPPKEITMCIFGVSLVLGLLILALLIFGLWKVGFFKRNLERKLEESYDCAS